MKRSIAILLLLAMILGVFAGCGKQGAEPTEAPTVAPTEETIPANAKEDLAAAAEYLKTYYKDALTLTARDYTRLGAVRVGLDQYPITWSVDVSEDIIKIVVNDDGTVTIDIADGIKEDTPYVLTATLTDAYGNVETVTFEYTIPASLGTMQEIVDMAYALENGEALEVEATLTGEIISVNTPYDAGYKNVTVTIKVAEREDFPIMCYRLKGEGADTITVGDTITVTGILKNYNGTIEFDAGCVLEEVIKGDLVFELPSDPKEIVDMAYALGVGESIPVKVTLTGKVTDFKETYTEQYKNISVWMTVEGRESKPILVYRVKGDEVAQVAVGDTITVSGSIINYNGTIEFTSGCSLDSRISGGGTPPSEPVSSFWGKVVNPGETYYMYMNIAGTKYYFTGKMDGKYLASSTNPGDAVEVTVEAADEYGRRFYFMDNGTKKYIEIYEYTRDDGKNRGAVSIVEVPSAVFYWNTDAHTYVVYGGITGDPYFMGTYGTYTTFSVSSTYYITGNNAANAGVSQYIADFMTPDEAPAPEEPPVVEDNYVTNPAVGTAYKLGLNQTQKGAIYYFTGVMSGFYGATDTDITKGVEVYLEEAEGGYYLTFNDAAGNKQYVYIEISGTHTNFKFGETKAVFTWDAEKATLSTKVGDEVCYIGTYGSYVTFGGMATSKLSEDTYFGHLYLSDGTTPEQPEQPEQPDVPSTDVPVVGTAYKFGMVQGNVGKTYYLKGGMDGFYMATTEDMAEAIDVYLEETTGGYYFYTKTGDTKTYINMVVSGTHVNGAYEATASTVYTWDAESKTIIAIVNDAPYWFGTRNDKNYTTMGPCATSFNGFYGQFYTQGGTTPEQPEQPEQPEEPEVPATGAPVVGTAYKFGMVQGNVGKTYYLKGGMDGFYMATTEDMAAAIDVYVEETTGGYYFYTKTGDTKTYINMVVSGTHVNGAYEATASTVYTWDAESETIIATVNDEPYWFGTRNDKNYTTMGPCATSFNGFYAKFYTVSEGGETPEQPEQPEQPEEPEVPATLAEQIAQANGLANGAYLPYTSTITGTITDDPLESSYTAGTYKFTVSDGTNTLLCYFVPVTGGTPAKGDKVTVTGNLTAYSGSAQFDKTATATLDKSTEPEQPEEPDVPVEPEQPVTQGNKADFNTIVTSNPNGDSGYTKTYTTTNGWTTVNCAIQTGGPEGCSNPQYHVIGPDNTYKAVCINGKASAPGKITSPTLTGGISKLTMKYTKMFTDTMLSVTITVTDLATGNVYTHVVEREEDKDTKFVIWTDEWILDTPVSGDFTVEIVNNCPTASTSNKDRMTVLELAWEGAPEVPAAPANATYVMADYVVSGELGGAAVIRDLDSNVKLTISSGWITSDTARIYKNSNAVIESKHPINSIVLNAGYKDSTFDVYTSEDGTSWNKHSNVAFTSAYADVTINFEAPVKYIKLDCPNAQLRFKTLTVNFAGGSAPVEPTPDPDQEAADAVIALIEAIGEVTLEKEEAIVAARTAYEALTDDQKALVTNLETLTAAEAALEELKKPTVPTDPIEILKAAYALADGDSLPYTATLTGKIISVDDAYNNQYQNVTVTMVVTGAESMPIKCYRMKGSEADTLNVNDIITVTGTIKNYLGTIEFDTGCTLDAVTQMDPPAAPVGAATLSFADKANRTTYTTSLQVWEQNGIKVTNEKAKSSSNVGDYFNPGRFYKNSSLKIEFAGMKKIVITSDGTAKYLNALKDSLTAAGIAFTASNNVITIELAEAADVFEIADLSGGQCRIKEISIYTA